VADSYECGNEYLISIECRELLEEMKNFQLPKKDTVPLS
jgi:hypothetical protein